MKDQTLTNQDIADLGKIAETDLTSYNPLQEKIEFLEVRIKMLSDICNDLNPYIEIPADLKMKLMNYNILDFSDPFKITNQLLMLLEDTIDELHVLKPFDDSNLEIKEIL